MYEHFFGFRERPFELTPDPRYLLLTPGHREALSNLEYGISARKAITVLTGEAGTGKTTLVRHVLKNAAGDGSRAGLFVQLTNPRLDRDEFIEYLADAFRLLVERRAADRPTALIIDEAHTLPFDLFEEVRLLVNIESDTEKLLPVILVGQPELDDTLNDYELRQLKQRVALRCHLDPLDLQETGAYIATRISLAGGDPARTFTREAVLAIHDCSRGIPRTINVVCDNALVTAFALERQPADADLIAEVVRDFGVGGSSPEQGTPTAAEARDPEPPRPAEATPLGPRRPWFGRHLSDG
jgi:general secretion pathway protein A